jgi:hypothetical protein
MSQKGVLSSHSTRLLEMRANVQLAKAIYIVVPDLRKLKLAWPVQSPDSTCEWWEADEKRGTTPFRYPLDQAQILV